MQEPSYIVLMLVLALCGGVRDLAGLVSTSAFWHAKGVTPTYDTLVHDLEPARAADVSKYIADLDSDEARDRDAAADKIAAVGTPAIPSLEEASKSATPEVATRARALIARIRVASKASSIRRLMAIRTLGELKDPRSLEILKPLLDSKDMFEADYARRAIAMIEGKSFDVPPASDAQRAYDLNLLPGQLDMVMQIAPRFDGRLTIDTAVDQIPGDAQQKDKMREEAVGKIIQTLETTGNMRLDAVTWGFYAAPPGVPGNNIIIARGQFDSAALSEFFAKLSPTSEKVGSASVFHFNADMAVLVTADNHVILLNREPGGDLGLDNITVALAKGSGHFSDNPDLPKLLKTVDLHAPLWGAAKLSPGLKQVAGPFEIFDTSTLWATQSLDDNKQVSTEFHLNGESPDANGLKLAVERTQAQLQQEIERGRQQEKLLPVIKPLVDFEQSIKLESSNGKVTASGQLSGMPMIGMLGMQATAPAMVQPPLAR